MNYGLSNETKIQKFALHDPYLVQFWSHILKYSFLVISKVRPSITLDRNAYFCISVTCKSILSLTLRLPKLAPLKILNKYFNLNFVICRNYFRWFLKKECRERKSLKSLEKRQLKERWKLIMYVISIKVGNIC